MLIYIGLIAGLVLSVLSSWFYDVAAASGWLPNAPSRKRLFIVIAACVPLILLVALPQLTSTKPSSTSDLSVSNFSSSEDAWCQFSLQQPEGWRAQNVNNPITKEIAVFIPVRESPATPNSTKLIVRCVPLPEVLSLSEYVDEFVIKNAKNTLPNIQKLRQEDFILANGKASKIKYETKESNRRWLYMDVVMLRSGYAYQITYVTPLSQYSKYKEEVKQMLESFTVKENNASLPLKTIAF